MWHFCTALKVTVLIYYRHSRLGDEHTKNRLQTISKTTKIKTITKSTLICYKI